VVIVFLFLSVNIICIKLLYFTVSVQIYLVSNGSIFQVLFYASMFFM